MAEARPRRPRRGAREAGFVLLCFAAASAVPFLSPEDKARLASRAFGAPPLLMLAAATVAGTGALWLLGQRGFFADPRPPGTGLGAALYGGGMLAAAAAALDLVMPSGRQPDPGWPGAWLFHPAAAVAALALLHLVPLAALVALLRRPLPAMLLAAAVAPGAGLAAQAAQGAAPAIAAALLAWATALVEFRLLRRHGLAAMVGFRMTHTLVLDILWGGARHALGPGGA
ncbi:MAG: hypothetical protein N2Z62_16390 [Rhodobacteraceae bacterium]|nr:hypothetical protein [Paracoccaceae bacterium]